MTEGERLNEITEAIIGAAIEGHRALGPGLLESAYLRCLAYERAERGLSVATEKPLPLVYRDVRLDCGYRLDLLDGQINVMEWRVGMDVNLNEVVVVNNEAEGQYEAHIGDAVAFIAYDRQGQRIIFTHSEVPPQLEGQGIAGKLAQTALDDALAQELTVVPLCPYVASYLRRHPEYLTIVAPAYRDRVTREAH